MKKAFFVGGIHHGTLRDLEVLLPAITLPYILVDEEDDPVYSTETYTKEVIRFGSVEGEIPFYFHPDILDDERTATAFSAIATWLKNEEQS